MEFRRSLLKIWPIRLFYVLLRYIILTKFKKARFKYEKNDTSNKNLILVENGETTIKYNSNFLKWNLFSNFRNFFLPDLLGLKCNRLINPLIEQPFIFKNINKLKILAVGPRTEGEIYNLYTKGFSWKNIYSIDLFSYSKKIDIGDVHDLPYPENFFDIILSSYNLTYSNNKELFIKNLVKSCKNGGIIAISVGNHKKTSDQKKFYENFDEFLSLFTNYIERIYFRTFSEDFDESFQKEEYYLIFKLKK